MTRRELIEHLIDGHQLCRSDMERSRLDHLVWTHDFRHSVPPGVELTLHGNSYGTVDHDHPRNQRRRKAHAVQ